MRFEFVPPRLLSTPQVLDVFVNACSLTRMQNGSQAVSRATSATTRSSSSEPLRTSPTSNAKTPPGTEIAATLSSAARTSAFQASRLARLRDGDGVGVDAREPAAHPVVALVVHDVQERRRRDGQGDGRPVPGEGLGDGLPEETEAPSRRRLAGQVAQEPARLAQDETGNVAVLGRLVAPGVVLALPLDRRGLVGRQGVDGEEAAGMAGQAVEGDHPDPAVDRVQGTRRAALAEVVAETADLVQGPLVEEDVEVVRAARPVRRETGPRAGPRPPPATADRAVPRRAGATTG